MKNLFIILTCSLWFLGLSSGQAAKLSVSPADSATVILDDILFKAVDYQLDAATKTATATLTLLNQKDVPRELRLNVFGTQIVDNKRNSYYISTISLGRVQVRFEDRQNYLNYLLQPDQPVTLTITATGISADSDVVQLVKIVFEDSKEEGRFIEAFVSGVPEGKDDMR
ncbi:hypothetical protein [Olivibacter sitiensis]|uniref:hypothetical protein n=1 Tax=Olivibacter sitiensis TaxID=376470 RepID=UPI00068480FF|nr:hypothetical protein [Olivibacter sitiensis]